MPIAFTQLSGDKVILQSRAPVPQAQPSQGMPCSIYQSCRPEKPALPEPGMCREVARVTALGRYPLEEDRQGNGGHDRYHASKPDEKECPCVHAADVETEAERMGT